jgi:hypothetical protein
VNNKKNTLCTSSSYEFVFNAKNVSINTNNQHRLIQAARSAQIFIDEETNDDLLNEHISQQQHQSN